MLLTGTLKCLLAHGAVDPLDGLLRMPRLPVHPVPRGLGVNLAAVNADILDPPMHGPHVHGEVAIALEPLAALVAHVVVGLDVDMLVLTEKRL